MVVQEPSSDQHTDLHGKIAVITGANAGLGFQTTVGLAKRGCTVVMCCRDVSKANEAREELLHAISPMDHADVEAGKRLRVVQLDLSDLENIGSFRERYDKEMADKANAPIDIVVLNAGIMAPLNRELSKQGIELQMATNVVGHFKFLAQVMDKCKASAQCRIVFVGSQLHILSRGGIDFDDFNRDRRYYKWAVYGESKLGMLLLMHRLNRVLESRSVANVIAVAVHPGYAATKIHEHTIAKLTNRFFALDPQRAAKSFVFAATDPAAQRNGYAGPRYFLGKLGDPDWGSSLMGSVSDASLQDKFWMKCEELTNAHLEEKI